MSSWQPHSGSKCYLDEEFDFTAFRDSRQLSRKYPPSKELRNELEHCKDQLGEWEVRAVAAEAEVTSLGFQKVAMELDVTRYKEQIEKLTRDLTAEKAKNRSSSVAVLEKISHIKNVLTSQIEELRKNEREVCLSLESVKESVCLFKNGGLSKESFFSQVDAIFDGINNRKNSFTNGKIIKTPQNLDERHSSLLEMSTDSQTSSETLPKEDSPPPPVIPPRTPITDESRQLQRKKPVPPPRKAALTRSKQVSSVDVHRDTSPDLQEMEGRSSLHRRRLSSRVDCLYALAPPPGSPRQDDSSAGGFVFRANIDWSLQTSSESDNSDYENITPLVNNSNGKASTEEIHSKKVRSISQHSKPSLSQAYSDYVSVSQEEHVVPSMDPFSPKEDKRIKKSSPIMTKRPIWFKRDSVSSTRTTPEMKLAPNEKTVKRRSRSLDANLQRKVSSHMDQFRDRPVALSDSEDTTGGSDSYPKPFHHIRMRKRFLTSRRSTRSQDNLEKMFATSANWHYYDNDSDTEDVYYINPDEVASRFTPKQSTVDAAEVTDRTYLMLSEPEVEKINRHSPQRKIGISVHSPSPIPIPNSKTHVGRAGSRGTSDGSSESGNESDDYEHSNIYENLDNEVDSPVGRRKHITDAISTDDTYARIDELKNNLAPIPAYIANTNSKYSSTQSISVASTEHRIFDTSDMLKEDGYARIGVRSKGVEAPVLPPRPPNFTRVRPSNQARTVPGIGSLPRYTTSGGSEREVLLVPIAVSSSQWQSSESLDALSESPPEYSPHSDTVLSQTMVNQKNLPRTSLQHWSGTPNPRQGSSEEKSSFELPPYSKLSTSSAPSVSTMSSALRNVSSLIPQRNSTLPPAALRKTTPPITTPVRLEKAGYLTLHDGKVKSKKKASKWFVLKGSELKYYASKDRKETRRKGTANNVINLDHSCKLSTTESGAGFQLDVSGKVYRLSANDEAECEEWLKVITAAMQGLKQCTDEEAPKKSLSGWARMDGSSDQMWCYLEDSVLVIAAEPGKEPVRRLDMERCSVRCRRDSILLDSSMSNLSRGQHLVLNIRNKTTREVTLLQPIKAGAIEEWCYILSSLNCRENGPELTRTEQFLSEIMKDNPVHHLDHPKWSNPIFKVTATPMHDSLISMPTTKLKEHAKGLFRDVQLFMNRMIDPSNLEFHMSLAQKVVSQCLSHSYLQNEVYCQLLRQMSGHTTPTATPVLQGWLLLFLLIPMYLPSRKLISWYLTIFLERSLSSKSKVICDLAKNCRHRAQQCSTSDPRQCEPTYSELKALFVEFTSSPLQPPTGSMETNISLSDGSLHTVVFSAMTTVSELVCQLTEKVGLSDSVDTGFALMCDWPGVSDGLLCCPFVKSKVCDVISMWTLSMEELNHNSYMAISEQRSVTFSYKRRLAFHSRQGAESSYECVLLAHQISNDVLTGVHPVPPQKAPQLSAIMAQLEYGDWATLVVGERDAIAREAVERFSPWSLTFMALEHDWLHLQAELTENWRGFAGKSREECARLYLGIAREWSLCGTTVHKAEQHHNGQSAPLQHVFLAIHEEGVSLLRHKTMDVIKSYSYSEISTFGGHGEEDFMLVVTPQDEPGSEKNVTTRGEKIILSMDKIQICEATFLMASYIEKLS